MRAAVKNQAELIAISYSDRTDLTFGSDDDMEKAHRQYVSGWMFSSFGHRPALGRLFTENDDIKPGGLGLHFIRQSMDIVEFRRARGANVLRLVKYLSQEGRHGN